MLKITVASALMAATALAVDAWMPAIVPGGGLVPQAIRLGTAIGTAGLVLAAAAHALHISEFRRGMALVTRRFSRKR
jgi:hypothetical protein